MRWPQREIEKILDCFCFRDNGVISKNDDRVLYTVCKYGKEGILYWKATRG